MPLQKCQKRNKPGSKWGKSGTCYIYTPGNAQSEKRAKEKALEQMKAIFASGYGGK